MASTKITRTSSASSEKKLTISYWLKRSSTGEESVIGNTNDGSNWAMFYFNGANKLQFASYIGGSYVMRYTTNRTFSDVGAWYHLVATVDVSLSTPEVKIYVNGEEQTSLQYNTTPSQNADIGWFNAWNFEIGVQFGSSYYLNGCLADLYYIQGYIHPASTFGETDATTGQWKPKTSPTINYGGNGGNSCHLKFENSANMDLDSGDNNLSLTTTGTITQTLDNPSNNFATLNVLQPSSSVLTITNGNTHIYSQSPNSWTTTPTTLAIPPTSKIYWEIKCIGVWGSSFCQLHGIVNLDNISQEANNVQASDSSDCYGWKNDGSFKNNGSTVSNTSWASSYTTNDILMFALDNSNGALYVGKNGSWLNSGDPTSGASKTGALPVTAGLTYAPHSETKYGSDKPAYNFGNGVFVSTAITTNSGNGYAGAEGKSKFNYQPPTGYSALTTLGMNE
tara:strand:- start:1274 stop:2623 length:1350 start_codon:yes stop_codon:yes gene_type:complete